MDDPIKKFEEAVKEASFFYLKEKGMELEGKEKEKEYPHMFSFVANEVANALYGGENKNTISAAFRVDIYKQQSSIGDILLESVAQDYEGNCEVNLLNKDRRRFKANLGDWLVRTSDDKVYLIPSKYFNALVLDGLRVQ